MDKDELIFMEKLTLLFLFIGLVMVLAAKFC